MCPGPGELSASGIMIVFFLKRTWDTYKSLKAVTERFSLVELLLNKVVAIQTINAG
jgi:hypothetical protein